MPELRAIRYSEPRTNDGTPLFLATQVPVRTLLDYLETGRTLDEFLNNFPDVKREHAIAFLEEAIETSESFEVDRLKKYDTVVLSGQSALRALLTLNGGATIAFLTFMGHLWEKGSLPVQSTDAFIGALRYFVYGTFAAVVGYGTIFLATGLSLYGWRKLTNWMSGVTVIVGGVSLAYFLIASWRAVAGFHSLSRLASLLIK